MLRAVGVSIFLVFAFLSPQIIAVPVLGAVGHATGHTSVAAVTNVLGGNKAPEGRFPYLCYMRYTVSVGTGTCTGFLIAPQWILTAAHCVDESEGERTIDQILCGVDNIADEAGKNRFQAVEVHIHESYDPSVSQLRFDIALVKLDGKVDSPVPLLSSSKKAPKEDSPAFIAGWGEFDNSGETSDNLRVAETFVVNNDDCLESWLETYPSFVLEDDRLCAGQSNGRTCYGDSGGPLIETDSVKGDYTNGNPKADVIVGITSFGVCDGDLPAVFTSVSYFSKWIDELTMDSTSTNKGRNNNNNPRRVGP